MASKKFSVPVKKNGSSFSFSSNGSSGSTLNESNKPLAPPAAPLSKPASNEEKLLKSKDTSFSVPNKKVSEVPSSSNSSVEKRTLGTTSKDFSDEPPAKRQILETLSTTSNVAPIKVEVIEDSNNDKENMNPEPQSKKTKAEKDKPKRPVKSLTDKEYDAIFNAVLSRYRSEESPKSPGKTIAEENMAGTSIVPDVTPEVSNADESKEMEFSQSELDSEEETIDEQVTVVQNKTVVLNEDSNEIPMEEGPNENDLVANSVIATTEISSLSNQRTENNCTQDQTIPPAELSENLSNENTDGSSQTAQQNSQQSASIKTETMSLSSNSQVTSTPFATPQKMASTIKVSSSQEQSISPIIHQSETTSYTPIRTPQSSQDSQVTCTPFATPQKLASTIKLSSSQEQSISPIIHQSRQDPKTPLQTPAITPTPQSSQDPKTPVQTPAISSTPQSSQDPKTPVQTPAISRTPQSSQGPKTPVRTPVMSRNTQSSQNPKTPVHVPAISRTPQSSQEPKTPVRMPVTSHTPQSSQDGRTPNAREVNPGTPNSSQQFSQEIQFTPPPSKKTARDRLKWIQKKRMAGLWVQCDKETCGKWRYLSDCHDPSTLPQKWFCRMHPDEEQNNCNAPENRESLQVEEDMIFNKYSPGSLVWARLTGHHWWPAMVEDDPDLEQFYWLNLFSDIPNWYHVVFFDADRKPFSRAWIPVDGLVKLEDLDMDSAKISAYFKERVTEAYEKACNAKNLPIEERLAKFSFATNYKGPIGGHSKCLYDGPIGHRKKVA